MQRLLLTLSTPAENLALDEALLDWAEDENPEGEFLRVWESSLPMVVVGRSSRLAEEVDEAACRQRDISVLRRSSGGAAIVAGPGCLMYAVVLSVRLRPSIKDIGRAHAYVLERVAVALQRRLANVGHVAHAGTSDLVLTDNAAPTVPRKFSGNSLRVKRTHVLYHGTLLYNFDLSLISACLRMPPRQPEYRQQRNHSDFVANLPLARADVVQAVLEAWPAAEELVDWPADRVKQLVAERFSQESWNRNYG